MQIDLITGKHYWYRNKKTSDRIWRIAYIGNDPDDNQWFFSISCPEIKLSKMNIENFDWVEIKEPNRR